MFFFIQLHECTLGEVLHNSQGPGAPDQVEPCELLHQKDCEQPIIQTDNDPVCDGQHLGHLCGTPPTSKYGYNMSFFFLKENYSQIQGKYN